MKSREPQDEQVDNHDNEKTSYSRHWLRTGRRPWTRLPGTRPVKEHRLTEAKRFKESVPTPSPKSHNEDSTRMRKCADKIGGPNTTACTPVRVSTRQENNPPSVAVCEVCRARSCIITRRPVAGGQCLCTIELHVPLDGSDRSVPVHHACASCRNDRFVEAEQQRKRRVRSTQFADSFSAAPCRRSSAP
jgi:hypothetical protein